MNTSQSTLIKPQFRTIDGLRIRYADSGDSHERTILFVRRPHIDPRAKEQWQ
jgi:hypothetical protein